MIIIDDKVVILMSPKCGTNSIAKAIRESGNRITFGSTLNITQCAGNYDDFRYNHSNLRALEIFCQNNNKDIKNYYVISLIRNPYKKYVSAYRFNKSKKRSMYMNCNFNEYIESHHLNQFIYTNYCMTENNKVDNVVDIKNFKEFWNTKVAPKYKLRQVYNIPLL